MGDRSTLPAWAQQELADLEARLAAKDGKRKLKGPATWADRTRPAYLDELVRVAAETYHSRPEDILGGRRRDLETVQARRAVYYILRCQRLSLPHIGALVDRDHASVLNGVRQVEKDPEAIAIAQVIAARVIPQRRTA